MVAILSTVAWTAGHAGRSLTVDDTLRVETVTDAEPSPDGRYILFIKERSSLARKDFAQDMILGPKMGQLLLVDLGSTPSARPLIDVPGESYALGPFSPDSRRVLIYFTSGRKLGLGCYDLATGRFTRLGPTPQLNSRTDFRPLWVSNREIIFPAEAGGEQPFESFNRPETARKLMDLWTRSWSGKHPGVVVSESRADGGGTEAESGLLIRANVTTGAVATLSEGAYSDLRLSNDGRYLAALRHFGSGQPPVSLNFDWTSGERLQLVLFEMGADAPSFASQEMTVGLGSLEWAPRDDKLAFFAWSPEQTSATGLYHVYDTRTRELSVLPHKGLDLVSERERGWFPRPERAAWLGDGIAVAARLQDDPAAPPAFTPRDYARSAPQRGIGWYLIERGGRIHSLTQGLSNIAPVLAAAAADRILVIADGQLWRIGPDGRRAPVLDRRHDGLGLAFPPTVRTAVGKQPLLLLASEGGSAAYLIVDPSGRRRTVTFAAPADDSLLAATGDGAALFASTAHISTEIALQRGPERQLLLHLNGHLDDVDLGRRLQISYRVPAGEDLTGCVMLPPAYVEGRRYPTIVSIYPGISGKCAPPSATFYSDDELLAAHGYVVLRPGNSPESIRRPQGPIAGMAGVVAAAIDASVRAGYSDPDRIGLWGASQGGWSSLWLATQMKQFKAIVSANGWADLASHYLGADHQQLLFPDAMPYAMNTVRYDPPEGSEQSIGKTLWQAPRIYVDNSPVMHADQVTAPVMLIGSDMDIFPLWQYQEMYSGLYRLRKPACLVVYMGEGHWPQSPANVTDLWARIFGWLDHRLRDGTADGCGAPAPPAEMGSPAGE